MEDSESNGKKKLQPNLQTRGNTTFEDELKCKVATFSNFRNDWRETQKVLIV
jgi:hypothetical protein